MRSIRNLRNVKAWGVANFFSIDFGNVGFKGIDMVLMHQRDGTAAKSRTRHTSAKNASLFPSGMHERIEFLTGYFVVEFCREMALVHQTSEVGEVTFF